MYSTDQRIRGRKLQEIRARHFAKYPLCVRCSAKNLIRSAVELDHTIALANGGKDVESNRQGLCNTCHVEKTAEDFGYRKRIAVGADGYPL